MLEDNGIVLEKEIFKEEMVAVTELYKINCATSEVAQLQKIIVQMDKYEVRREVDIQITRLLCFWNAEPNATVLGFTGVILASCREHLSIHL